MNNLLCKTILYNSHESFIGKKQLQREDITLQRLNWKRFIIFHLGVRIDGKNYAIETRKIEVNTCSSELLCTTYFKPKHTKVFSFGLSWGSLLMVQTFTFSLDRECYESQHLNRAVGTRVAAVADA